MKALIVLMMMMMMSGSAIFASDKLEDEIICNKITEVGEADNQLTLKLQSNAAAFVKNVGVYVNGYLGAAKIANIQVPLKPSVRVYKTGYMVEEIHTYKGKGLNLEIAILQIKGKPLNGGRAKLSLPGFKSEVFNLECSYAK